MTSFRPRVGIQTIAGGKKSDPYEKKKSEREQRAMKQRGGADYVQM